jgi:hypothetical protein
LSLVVKNKKATGRRAKLAAVTVDVHASDGNANEGLAPVLKKGTTRQGKTRQGESWLM